MWNRNILLVVGIFMLLFVSCSNEAPVAPFVEPDKDQSTSIDLYTTQHIRGIETGYSVGFYGYKDRVTSGQTGPCSILNPYLETLSHISIFESDRNLEGITIELRGCLDKESIDSNPATDSVLKVGRYNFVTTDSSNLSAVVTYTDSDSKVWSTALGSNPITEQSLYISAIFPSDDTLSKNIVYGTYNCIVYDTTGNPLQIDMGEFKCRIKQY